MCLQKNSSSSTMKNQATLCFKKKSTVFQKKKKKKLKEYYPNERQFKMAIVKKHRKTQKGITMRSRIILLYRRNPLPKRLKLILELKNSIKKMKNSLESTGNRADRVEEIVSLKI